MNYAPGSSVMPFDDTSRMSRITATVAHSVDNFFEKSNAVGFDQFFFIIDELGRCSPPNSVLTFIQFAILGYQYYISFYYSFLRGIWDFNYFPDKTLRYLTYPVDFGLGDSEIFSTGIVSYILLILSLLIIVYLTSIFIYFQRNKMFPRHNAHITRFVFSFLIPTILAPLCYNVGFSMNSIFNDHFDIESTNSFFHLRTISSKNRPLFIASTFFGLLFYLILLFLFYIDVMFRSSTPYLENTSLSMWDGKSLFLGVFGSTTSILSSAVVERLPKWASVLLLILAVIYNGFVLYGMFIFPMVKHYMNACVSTLLCGAMIASLFQLFPIGAIYRLCIPFGLTIVCYPVFWFVFRRIRRKFADLELDDVDLSTENKCLRFMRLAIADKCADFVTFNWTRKVNHVETTRVLSQAAQMVSFFPLDQHHLKFYIDCLSKKTDLSLNQRFLLFQLRRVHILRQSSTSKQINEDIEEISKATSQSIASFSQFLIRTIDERQELSLDSLGGLARLNRTTSSLCHEAMARYPNNARLFFIFSRYVIECLADFKTGISLYQEGQLINHRKRASVDFAFRAMVNLFPQYLYRRILDSTGRTILSRRRQKTGSSMSVDSSKNVLSDTDIESNEKIAKSVLENPRTRLSLKKSINSMNSKGILIITLSWILRFLLSFVICILIICIAPNFLGDRSLKFQSIAQISAVRKSVDLSLFRLAKLWSLNLNLSPKQKDVTAALGPDITLDDYNNITVNPKNALYYDVINSIDSIEKLGSLFVSINYQESLANSSSDFTPTNTIYFCNRETKESITSVTSVLYFSLYLLNQAVSVINLSNSHPSEWKNEECICEVILNMQNILEAFNNQSGVLVNQEEKFSTLMERKIIIFFCVIIPCIFAIYIIPFIVGYVKMNSEFKQIFDVLNLLPIEIYKEASKPIAIFQSDLEQAQEAISHITVKGCQKIVIVLPAILSSIIIAGSLIGIFFLIRDVNVKFYTLVKWLEIGSRRTPLLIETITNGILAGIYGYIGETDYTNHVVHLDNVFSYSQRLLYQHKTLIWGDNDSTSCNNFTKRLDDLHFVNTCVINMQGESLQSNYKCMSLDQQIMTFNKFAKDAYLTMIYAQSNSNISTNHTSNLDDVNNAFLNILNGYEMINLHYLGITYLLPRLEEAQDILNELINLKIDQLKHYSIIISLCTLVAQIILFIIEIFIINNLKDEFNIVRILIARLPPSSVVENQSIVELITGNSDISKSKNLTPIEVHIRYCSNPIIVFNKICKIQLVNKATTDIFGFTKEQLYNANISTVIEKENANVIQEKCTRNFENKKDQKSFTKKKKKSNKQKEYSEKELYSQDQENNNNADLSFLLNDSDNDNINLNNTTNNNNDNQSNNKKSSEIVDLYNKPFPMIVIGMKDDGTKIILKAVLTYLPPPDDVYALIMKDETQIYINKNDIRESKMRAIDIRMHVLPLEIAQNEKIKEKISFSLKLVSVINIKITNFNESVMSYTSVQAIRNMAELFRTFDEQLVKYPTLTKTFVISESYQAIGGLFNNKSIKKCTSRTDENMNEDDPNQDFSTTRTFSNSEVGTDRTEANNELSASTDNNNASQSENNSDNTSQPENNNTSNANQPVNNNAKNENQPVNNNAKNENNNTNNTNENINNDITDKTEPINNNSIITTDESSNDNTNNNNFVDDDSNADREGKKLKIEIENSRKSIHDIKSLSAQSENFADIVLDSIYFAFNCMAAAEYINTTNGTNFVLAIAINVGGPVTAGTLGKENMQFEVVGEAVKSVFTFTAAAEPGTIVIASDAIKFIKSSDEAQRNLIFQKYKKIKLAHKKVANIFIVKPSSANQPRTNDNDEIEEEEEKAEEEASSGNSSN